MLVPCVLRVWLFPHIEFMGVKKDENVIKDDIMTAVINAICNACKNTIELSQKDLEQLGRSESVPCSECDAMLKITPDANSERNAKLSVFTLTIGAAIVAIVALINIFGDAGFPTYFVAIPFILISTLLVSSLSNSKLNLERVD